MLREAQIYLDGCKRRALEASERYAEASRKYQQGLLAETTLAKLKRHADQCHRDWKQAIDRVALDAKELQFRMTQRGK